MKSIIESRKIGRRKHLQKFVYKECGVNNARELETFSLERFVHNLNVENDDGFNIPLIGFEKLILHFRNYLKTEFGFEDIKINSLSDDEIKIYLKKFPYGIESIIFPYYPK